MNKSIIIIPILTAVAIGWGSVAQAASPQTGNLQVKITITKDCQVNAGNGTAGTAGDAVLDFGSQGVLNKNIDQHTASTGTGSIQVQCTNGTAYNIGLGSGLNATDINSRKMKNGTETVAYQLYLPSTADSKTADFTKPWGTTIGSNTLAKTADGTIQTYPVFGRVPPQATPSAGTYNDTVAITVTF